MESVNTEVQEVEEEEVVMVDCVNCGGSGEYDDVTCNCCQGTGRMMEDEY